MLVLTNIKDTRNGQAVKLPNNTNMNETKAGILPLSISLSIHAKKEHIFDGLHSASLIYLGQLSDDYCISILDKNEINILKVKTLILKGHRNNTYGLWDIPISVPVIHCALSIVTRDKTKT